MLKIKMSDKEKQQNIHSNNNELCCDSYAENYPNGLSRVDTEEILKRVEEINKEANNIANQISIMDRWRSGN